MLASCSGCSGDLGLLIKDTSARNRASAHSSPFNAPGLGQSSRAGMSTIYEKATGSPVNSEQNAGCSLFRKEKQLYSALKRSSDMFEMAWLRCTRLLSVFKCKRGKLQMQHAERFLEGGGPNAPEQI